ncbi:MAG: flavin reductase family protein [Clostridiales bacterium]|jgi:flavin reductase (DIM6/NTAB) family NADH-FMN oxidoreductase RutF|nr:flavin reductase family protein [Clostridiales bacterium]
MTKKEIGAVACLYPIPAVVVGTKVRGKTDYALFGNCGIISAAPATVYISSDKKNFTNSSIKKAKVFSINVPSAGIAAATDFCGLFSGKKTDKSSVFTAFFGATGAPMAEECPVNIECKLKKIFNFDDTEIFVAEIVNSFVSERCLTNGQPDIEKIAPLIYDVANKYRTIGKWSVDAEKIGRDFQKQAEKRAEEAMRTAKTEKKAAKLLKKNKKQEAKREEKAAQAAEAEKEAAKKLKKTEKKAAKKVKKAEKKAAKKLKKVKKENNIAHETVREL